MVASLLVATSIFGDNVAQCQKPACPPKPCPKPCPQQPCPPTQMCQQDPCCPAWAMPLLNAGYNYPARIQTRCPWDVYIDASFIYWQPMQENMEYAFKSNANATIFAEGRVLNQSFSFKPGFQVGIGFDWDMDNWDSHLQYTWFHGTHSSSTSVNGSNNVLFPMVGLFSTTQATFDYAKQKWKLNMDLLDGDLGRRHYVGTDLMFRPAIGMRAAWIRQDLTDTFTDGLTLTNAGTLKTTGKTHSWAIGPRFSLDTDWNIIGGFRLFGNGAADILYTRYTKLSTNSTLTNVNGIVSTSTGLIARQNGIAYLRPHLELELGMGWGTYIDCNNWYMDFAASYGFQVFYNQNMFRYYTETAVSNVVETSPIPSGDLFVQGLNLTFRLDF